MYLKRKIDEYLLEWKKMKKRLPLIIKVQGRLEKRNLLIILQEQNYSNIVSINFVLELNIKQY